MLPQLDTIPVSPNHGFQQRQCFVDSTNTRYTCAKRRTEDKNFFIFDADIRIGTGIKTVFKTFQQAILGVGWGKKLWKQLFGQGKNALFALIVRDQQNRLEAAINLSGKDKISGVTELAGRSAGIDLRFTRIATTIISINCKYLAKNPFLSI